MHYQYKSICRGGDSILEKLKAEGINPEKYISFFSLRKYERINAKVIEQELGILKNETTSTKNDPLVTEGIYVHSKLLIADDRVVICGSGMITFEHLFKKSKNI